MSKILVTGGAGFTRLHRQRAEWCYTYVLESTKDGNLYVGWTDNLTKRLREHNTGQVTSTEWRRPLTLIYFEACFSKKAALRRERYFKTGFGRRFLKNRLAGSRLPAYASRGEAGGGRVGSRLKQ